MARIEVRPARPGDGEDLARNWIEMGSHYAALDPDAFQAPAADGLTGWFEELLRQPRADDSIWLVAEVDGRVVGTVDAHLERPADDASRQILRDLARLRLTVDALGVEEAYRRQGVGTRLLRAGRGVGTGPRRRPDRAHHVRRQPHLDALLPAPDGLPAAIGGVRQVPRLSVAIRDWHHTITQPHSALACAGGVPDCCST
jgi:GNAT superfamily N-acetyltransferase